MTTRSTQSSRFVTVDVADSVATVTIDKPPANAFNPSVIAELLEILPALTSDESIRCILMTGTGRFFVAGADITVMRELTEETQRAMRPWVDVQRILETAPKPVIAKINGHALGGGAELALACDFRVMATSATIGFPEINLGLFPGAGGSQRLPRLIGAHKAKLLMIEGARLSAERALDIGLVDTVVDDEQLDAHCAALAADLASKPTATIGMIKRIVDEGISLPLDQALDIEFEAVLELIKTDDAAEGLQSFLDKRPPTFTGH